MLVVQTLLALVFRSTGDILNTAFGWATVMLFGKFPQSRETYLNIMALGSAVWMLVSLVALFPSYIRLILPFVPVLDWVDETTVRLVMLVAAVLIPPAVGFVSLYMLDPEERPRSATAKAAEVLRGYPYTLGLIITLLMMTLFAPVMKIRDALRGWTSQHIPMIVESEDYPEVVEDIQKALAKGGLQTERKQASWLVRLPTKVVTAFAGRAVANLVADNLALLKSEEVEVLLHPSDLVIRGRERKAARARAIVAEQLAYTKAYMTWDKEANELEDRLRSIWYDVKSRAHGSVDRAIAENLQAVERDLRSLEILYEEWEVLFRKMLLLERSLQQVADGSTDEPRDLTEARPEDLGAANLPAARS